MAQCEYTKKDRLQCKNHSMHNSIYCYVHSFGKFKGVPFFKNSTFHFILSVVLTLAIFIYTNFKGPSLENQKTAITKTEESIRVGKEVKNLLLQSMEQINQTRYEVLINKYPLGYILFAVDHSEIIVSNKGSIQTDYALNISDAKVVEINSNKVKFMLPDIHYIPRNLTVRKLTTTVPRKKNTVFPYPIGMFPNDIYFEILEDKGETIIYVVGFK